MFHLPSCLVLNRPKFCSTWWDNSQPLKAHRIDAIIGHTNWNEDWEIYTSWKTQKWIFLLSLGKNIKVLFWMQVINSEVSCKTFFVCCYSPPLTAGWGQALVSSNLIKFSQKNVNMQHYTLLNSSPIQPPALFVG